MLLSVAGGSVGELNFLKLNSWKTVLISSIGVNQGLPADLTTEFSSRGSSLTNRNVIGTQNSTSIKSRVHIIVNSLLCAPDAYAWCTSSQGLETQETEGTVSAAQYSFRDL